MKILFEFDDFMVDLDLTEVQQAMIRNFVRKYEKYFNFHDPSEFENSIDKIIDDVMVKFSLHSHLRDDVKEYISNLHTLSDGISVVMTPDPHMIYKGNPDMVQTIIG